MMRYLLEENLKRGEPEFPVSLYTMKHLRGPILPCHWQEEPEILFVASGRAEFQISSNTYRVGPGDVLFVNSGEIHSGCCDDPEGCSYYAVVYRTSFLHSLTGGVCQRIVNELEMKKTVLPHFTPPAETDGELNRMAEEIIECLLQKEPGYELFVKGRLFTLLSVFVRREAIRRAAHKNAGSRNREARMKNVINYIAQNYQNHIYVEDLAEIAQMNKYNFCRFFKEYAGVTPIDFLNLQRINIAYDLLVKSSCSVTDAALQVGFDNMSYFARTFKKFKNITPSQIKKSSEALYNV